MPTRHARRTRPLACTRRNRLLRWPCRVCGEQAPQRWSRWRSASGRRPCPTLLCKPRRWHLNLPPRRRVPRQAARLSRQLRHSRTSGRQTVRLRSQLLRRPSERTLWHGCTRRTVRMRRELLRRSCLRTCQSIAHHPRLPHVHATIAALQATRMGLLPVRQPLRRRRPRGPHWSSPLRARHRPRCSRTSTSLAPRSVDSRGWNLCGGRTCQRGPNQLRSDLPTCLGHGHQLQSIVELHPRQKTGPSLIGELPYLKQPTEAPS